MGRAHALSDSLRSAAGLTAEGFCTEAFPAGQKPRDRQSGPPIQNATSLPRATKSTSGGIMYFALGKNLTERTA